MIGRKRKQGTRRADRERARRRLRRWAGFGLSGCTLGLVLGAFAAGVIPLPLPEREFPIRTLKVESTFERVSREEVTATVAPHARGFFETDVAAIRGALVELPWVRAASVRRVWPDALHVTLVEEQAAARWAGGGLVSVDGKVFHPPQGEADGLPLLEGPSRSARQMVDYYFALQRELAPLGLQIVHLGMDARRAWELTLSNGIRLTLGSRDADRQVQRFVRFYPQVMAARAAEIEQVDLRYSNGFAVRWRASGAAARASAAEKTGDAV